MKKKILSILLTAIMSFSVLPDSFVLGASETVYNWTVSTGGNGQYCLIDSQACFGNFSLSLSAPDANSSASAYTQIAVKAGETYRFTFWVKGEALSTANAVIGKSKMNLASTYSLYYWTCMDYEFTATEDSSNYKIGFEISKGGTLCIDDACVMNVEKKYKNLIKNGGFERVESKKDFLSGTSLPMEEELASFGEKNVMPMLYMDDFELDGDLGEWDGYAKAVMPNGSTDMTGMKGYSGETDLFAELMLAYDDKNFYVAAKVLDDVFDNPNSDSKYWKGDSLQLAIGTVEEDFGVEVGLYRNNDGVSSVYSSELIKEGWGTIDDKTMYLRENSKVIVKRVGNITYYEAQLPWLFRFDSVPEDCLINILVNDSDGDGRKGFFELTPGIGFTKSNEKFLFGTPIEKSGDIFGYIDGPKWLYQEQTGIYSLYVANPSEKAEDIIITLPDNTTEAVNVPAKQIYKYDYTVSSGEVGMHSDALKISYADKEIRVKKNIQIKRDLIKAFSYIETERLPVITELEEKCREKGINPVYEHADINIITNFIDYGREDLAASRDSRAEYVYNELIKLCDNVEEALSAYLDGSREPVTTYLYKGDKIELEGMHYNTLMQNTKTGEMEERPVYFIGYDVGGTNSRKEKTYKDHEAIGANLMQVELPLEQYVSKGKYYVRGWSRSFQGDVDATISYDSDVVKSGDYSLKITNNTPQKANTYVAITKNVSLQKDKTYALSFWIKANNASGVVFRPNGWGSGSMKLNGTYDWKKITYEYSPKEDETKELILLVENTATSVNVDNFRLVEKGTKDNLITFGSFEELPVIINGYGFDTDRVKNRVVDILDWAQKYNIQMDILFGLHYFPNIVENWNLPNGRGYYRHNVDNPEVLKVMEAMVTGVMEKIKDHPALHSICLSNEPSYQTARSPEVFTADWISYIKKLYNNDISLLNSTYGTQYTSFEEVPLTEDTENDVLYYDYIHFNAEVWGGWHRWLADTIKKVAPNVRVHSKIQAVVNTTEKADAVLGTPLFARGIDPEMFDGFSDISGCDCTNFISNEKELLKKEMWYDLQSSFGGKPVFNSEDHVIVDGDETYTAEYAPFVSADLWQGAVHNRSDAAIWIWTRTTDLNNSFSGNINHRPDVLSANSRMNLDVNRLSREIAALQAKPENVGILYSLQSRIYDYPNPHMHTISEAYRALTFAGERVKFFSENMIETKGIDENIKLLIIGNAASTNAETVKAIRSFIERGGKVMVIGEIFRYDNKKKPLSNPEDVQFILDNAVIVPSYNEEKEVKFDFDFYEYMADFLKEMGIRNIELVDAETGKPVARTEYTSGVLDGKTIINIINPQPGTVKKFRILINGNEPENMTELRSGEKVSGVIELPSHIPMLIRID